MRRAESLLMYGSTDTGKSSQLGEIAKWEFARTGRVTRLISADSGWQPIEDIVATPERPLGTSNPDGSFVSVEAWNIQSLSNPWVILTELSEGYWPVWKALSTGALQLKMQKPTMKDGWIEIQSGGKSFQLGQTFIEGLSTIATVGMQDHITSGRKVAEDLASAFQSQMTEVGPDGKETQRTLTLGSAGRAHFGHVQRWLLDDLVPRFGRMPVERVIWTAHEARGTDDITGVKDSVLGPATVGKAVVDKTTLKFGHSFHMTVDTTTGKDTKGQPTVAREFKAWFVSHPDDYLTKYKWPAKVSLSIAKSQEWLRKNPGGFLPLTGGRSMTEFLEFLAGGEK